MRYLLALVGLVLALLLAACGPGGRLAQPAAGTWTQVAVAQGSITASGALMVGSRAQGDSTTLTAQPARLVIDVTQVHGAGARLYLIPAQWHPSQPVNNSDFASYPEEFLVASVDTTGQTVVDVPHDPGRYSLTRVGGVLYQSGATFSATFEQLR